jgi:ABC-type multidrug transport system fused ATPase/permease subunit
LRIYVRVWPHVKPQLLHLIAWLALTVVIGSVVTFMALVEVQIMSNKILLGEPLDSEQARMFFLDSSYVETDSLTDEQRITLFFRLLAFLLMVQLPFMMIAQRMGVGYYKVWISQRINQHLRVTMIENSEHLSLRYHSHARTGEAIYRVYQDSAMITGIVASWVLDPIEHGINVLFALFVIFLFSPLLGCLCLLTLVPAICLIAWYTPYFQRASWIARQTNSNLTSRIQEVAAAIRVMKANQAEATAIGRFDHDSNLALDGAYYLRRGQIFAQTGVAIMVGSGSRKFVLLEM